MLIVLALLACGPKTPEPVAPVAVQAPVDAPAGVQGLFHVEHDMRRCAAPLCGGWWLSAVNAEQTECPDGPAERCYVSSADGAIAHGGLVQATMHASAQPPDVVIPPTATVSASWSAVSGGTAREVYQIGDNGVRCITAPCPSISAALVGAEAEPITDIDASAVGKHDPQALGEAVVAGDLFAAGVMEQRDGAKVFVASELWIPATR